MRPIKFRAWDKANNEMYQARTLTWDAGMNVAEGQDDVMQFTGLLDKNGREIYEGDVVEFWNHHTEKMLRRTVEWSDTDLGYDELRGVNRYANEGHGYTEHKGIEVIGNIYENPELLKS